MSENQGDITSCRHAAEGDAGSVDVKFGLAGCRMDILQCSNRILDTNGERILGDKAISDVDHADISLDGEVFAYVRFGVEVAETPAFYP